MVERGLPMIKLLMFSFAVLGGVAIILQVIMPAILNQPFFSWFRPKSRLDKAKYRIRVAKVESKVDELELEAYDLRNDRLDALINKQHNVK